MPTEFIAVDIIVKFKAESKKEVTAMRKAVKEAFKAVKIENAKTTVKMY